KTGRVVLSSRGWTASALALPAKSTLPRSAAMYPALSRLIGKFAAGFEPPPARARAGSKPRILVIFGDDIGQTSISAYSFGLRRRTSTKSAKPTPNTGRRTQVGESTDDGEQR